MAQSFVRRFLIPIGAIILIVVILFVIFAVAANRIARDARTSKEGSLIGNLHTTMIVYARQHDGRFPTPGLINRLPHPIEGNVPGVGAEDYALNTTAHLYSALIGAEYCNAPVVISLNEPSEHVVVKSDYNYNAYDPANDSYWDTTFAADLHDVSNASYAHLPIPGKLGAAYWNDTVNPRIPILSNRGPKDGTDPSSITYRIHGSRRKWIGNVVFADNHVEVMESVWLDHGNGLRDNLFAISNDMDAILSFTKSISADGFELDWD